ncbi:hypothetical protein N9C84_01105 [Desulfobacterales bacterium]|nr:hypothetical protein [Desulfobacterales bacterium]
MAWFGRAPMAIGHHWDLDFYRSFKPLSSPWSWRDEREGWIFSEAG